MAPVGVAQRRLQRHAHGGGANVGDFHSFPFSILTVRNCRSERSAAILRFHEVNPRATVRFLPPNRQKPRGKTRDATATFAPSPCVHRAPPVRFCKCRRTAPLPRARAR